MKKQKSHGGARPGAGRNLKYGEPTERIFFTVPESKKEIIVEQVKKIIQRITKT